MHKILSIDIDSLPNDRKKYVYYLTILLNTKVANLFEVNKFNYSMIKYL